MVVIGAIYLIGGFFLRRYRQWANRLVSAMSIVIVLAMFAVMLSLAVNMRHDHQVRFLWWFPLVVALAASTPLVLLVRYLNREEIKHHFT
jgi:hypothetical protein